VDNFLEEGRADKVNSELNEGSLRDDDEEEYRKVCEVNVEKTATETIRKILIRISNECA
jgi:hypothetical protein